MIDWMDESLKVWGRAKYRLMTSQEAQPQSIAGRIIDYGMHVDEGTSLHEYREGFTGEALKCSLAIHRAFMAKMMTDKQYEAVFTKYVVPGRKGGGLTDTEKAIRLGYKNRQAYYQVLDRAHNNLCEFFY